MNDIWPKDGMVEAKLTSHLVEVLQVDALTGLIDVWRCGFARMLRLVLAICLFPTSIELADSEHRTLWPE